MKHDFSDRCFLITGAGRGLGRHLAETLARYGATVGVADIDADSCHATVTAIEHAGGNALAYPGDVGQREGFLEMAESSSARPAASMPSSTTR
jgi:NAD(P)-dependent dehydrogenase (short-subunit alcohol dehydrogenase family)